tara:strand:+ start:194 stop:481 length:288 start_codon:yes stop_codon:yes gene_type:complete
MVVGWLLCINVGSLIARYLKKGSIAFPQWFPLHVWLQSAGAVISIIGVGFIYAHIAAEGSSHLNGLHQVSDLSIFFLIIHSNLFTIVECVETRLV